MPPDLAIDLGFALDDLSRPAPAYVKTRWSLTDIARLVLHSLTSVPGIVRRTDTW